MAMVAFEILGIGELNESIEQLYTKVVNDEQAYTLLTDTIADTDEQAERMNTQTLTRWQNELNRVDSGRYDNYYVLELIYTVQQLMDREQG